MSCYNVRAECYCRVLLYSGVYNVIGECYARVVVDNAMLYGLCEGGM